MMKMMYLIFLILLSFMLLMILMMCMVVEVGILYLQGLNGEFFLSVFFVRTLAFFIMIYCIVILFFIIWKLINFNLAGIYTMQSPTGKQQRHDATNTSNFNTSQQYVAGLKHAGYTRATNNNIDSGYLPRNTKITGSRLGERIDDPSKSNSRIQYSPSPGVIVHQYPSRPVRSPSPAFRNPNANVIPPANFIYNSPGSNQSSRVVNLSPPKIIRTEQQVVLPNPQPRMVPAALYQSCAQQCKVWQQKYNELYNTFLKTQSELANLSRQPKQYTIPVPDRETSFGVQKQEYEYMMRQNKKLRERVKQLERNQEKMAYNMEDIITRLVNKYRESTLKESMLLVDRYRLEKKMAQKI